MGAKTRSKRVRAKQVWTAPGGGFSKWSSLATHMHIDFCCDCGLAHEVQYAVFLRKGKKIGRLLPKNGTQIMRRVRLAPRRTAAKRRSRRLAPVAKAIRR